jgi:hypothetical protein
MKIRIAIFKSMYGMIFPTIGGSLVVWALPAWYTKTILVMMLTTMAFGIIALLIEYLEVNDEKLIHRNILGKRSILWKDVKGYLSGDEKRLIKKRDVRIDIPWEEITLIDMNDKPFPLGDLSRFRDYELIKQYILRLADADRPEPPTSPSSGS